MQQAQGLPVRWLTADEVDAINPTMAPGCTLGATYCDEDGYITPPRNVAAYTAALVGSGVVIAERTRFCGLAPGGSGGSAGTVQTSRGPVSAGLVVLAGGPQLAAVGALAGISIPAGGVRHTVAVTEEHPAFADRADGVRRAVGDVLAAGGGRAAVRDERSRTSRRARTAASTSTTSR